MMSQFIGSINIVKILDNQQKENGEREMNFNSRLLWTIERHLLLRLLSMLQISQTRLWKQLKVVL